METGIMNIIFVWNKLHGDCRYEYSDSLISLLNDGVEFTVILKNLNYETNQEDTTKETAKERLLELIKANSAITTKELAK